MSIHLSKKYGVNPSVEICSTCGKEIGVVLFGASYKDEKGSTAEAPDSVCMGNLCDDCKKIIKDGGIFFIEVRSDREGVQLTGRVCAIKEEAVSKILKRYDKVNYMESNVWEWIFDNIKYEER